MNVVVLLYSTVFTRIETPKGLGSRKSEVESGLNCTVFLQPCQRLQISPDNILLHKILSFEGIIKGFLVKEVAIEGTQRNLSRHGMIYDCIIFCRVCF